MNLYCPTDVTAANERFGASCGHAAIAAILGIEVTEAWQRARHAFEGRAWVSAPAMEEALSILRPGNWRPAAVREREQPVRGLALIQFMGPWMEPGLPLGAQLSRTHWIAADVWQDAPGSARWPMVYDINAAGWSTRAYWEANTLPRLLGQHKRTTGWYVRRAYEVQPVLLSGNAAVSG